MKFPRQCVFFGTTNDTEFLKDKTGNRRFWPVVTGVLERKKNLWSQMVQSELDQIWVEALHIFKNGEKLYLEHAMEQEAMKKQEQLMEEILNEGMIHGYIERLLPEKWEDKILDVPCLM